MTLPMRISFIILLTAVWQCQSVEQASFEVCKNRRIVSSPMLETVKAKSRIQCAAACLRAAACGSSNFIKENGTCELLPGIPSEDCKSIGEDSSESVIKKKTPQCINGGSWNFIDQNCGMCTMGYAGKYCERRIIDCEEGRLNGQTSGSYQQVLIQPENSAQSFPVMCKFQYGLTMVWRRGACGSYGHFNQSWLAYKEGFGDINCNFFLGLENIHLLTIQRKTVLKLITTADGSGTKHAAYYRNFRIDDEFNKYSLHYDSYKSHSTDTAGDGFGMGAPTSSINHSPFCTLDRDSNACARMSSSGWWFNTECATINTNIAIGDAELLKWPRSSIDNSTFTAVDVSVLLQALIQS